MERLSLDLLKRGCPSDVHVGSLSDAPERILQFGEGNFLRAFVDWMVGEANDRGLFAAKVVIVQPLPEGKVNTLTEQNGLYTLLLRGPLDGKLVSTKQVITCVSRALDPYRQWQEFLECAGNPALRFIVSNTTEVGITFVSEPRPTDSCPVSFPAKVTAFLHERFERFGGAAEKGLVLLPCELIESNGAALKAAILRHAAIWKLGKDFSDWVDEANVFANTLVDRIVTGYPVDEADTLQAELGYQDDLLVAGEPFHLWVIEADSRLAEELPLARAGCNVLWTRDVKRYSERKVRILNGAHTASAPVGFLAGKDTIKELMNEAALTRYVRRLVFNEILPTLDLPEDEKLSFADRTLERFTNPFIKHRLLQITTSSVSKWRVRVLPSIVQFAADHGQPPPALAFSLAALFALYRGTKTGEGTMEGRRAGATYPIKDEHHAIDAFAAAWQRHDRDGDLGALCGTLMGDVALWGTDLNRMEALTEFVTASLAAILEHGVTTALAAIPA